MRAAVLTIGDELTCGYRLDTNSQVVSRRLASVPIDVVTHMTVSDGRQAIQRGLRTTLDVADVIIVTGGLGPTEDDLTRQTIADHFGLDLVEDVEALARIRAMFAHRGRTMPESNRIQAQIPAGSQIIYNDRGTAAGFYLPVGGASLSPASDGAVDGGRHIFVTPGIPYEMDGMLESFILPRLRELAGAGHHVRRAALKVYGIPESEINERIRSMLARGRNPLLGLLPSRGTITVEVVAAASTPEEAEALIERDLVGLRAELGPFVISEDERELPKVVTDLLVEQRLTIATVELGTSGLVAARLTEPQGSERWFRRGIIFGSDQEAAGGKRTSSLTREDEVLAMANAVRQAAEVDVGLGVGPICVPEDSTSERPYGVVHAAVNVRGRETCRRFSFNGDHARVREWAADSVLALVRLCLLGLESCGERGEPVPIWETK